MIHRTLLRGAFGVVVVSLLSAPAQAQLFRAYLAPSGNDANPCTLAQPCRLLPAALTAVASGGEIWILESANYNSAPVNIAKSVTILAVPGVVGSVVATGGNAIDIATAGVKVALRNLVIVALPGGAGTGGINMTSGAGLTVEKCLIANLPGTGIDVSAAANVTITDTTIRGNGDHGVRLQNGARGTVTRSIIGGNVNNGLLVTGSAAGTTTTGDLADSTVDANGNGVSALSHNATAVVNVSIRDSRIVRNAGEGLSARSNAGASVALNAASNIVSNNDLGIVAFIGGKVWASGNTVSDNGFGLINLDGLFESAGNNAVRNNSAGDTSGTIGVIATK